MAIFGWYTHCLVLLRWQAGMNPIVFDSALALALLGFSLLALAAGRRRWVFPGAAGTAVIGLLSCAEIFSGRSLGIDQAFVRAWAVAPGHVPGQMAPNAAIGYLVAGAALLVASRGPGRYRDAVVGVAGSATFALGAVAVFGYATAPFGYRRGDREPSAARFVAVHGVPMWPGVPPRAAHAR
jgi:hypothetical protein